MYGEAFIHLLSVVADSYQVFSKYQIGRQLRVCKCNSCMSDTFETELVYANLSEIPAPVLAEYTNSAHGWDDVVANEMRYFLPRYLDLIANDDIPDYVCEQKCLRRLQNAEWRTSWPAAEVAVLDRFFEAFIACKASDLTGHEGSAEWVTDSPFHDALLLTLSAGANVDLVFTALWNSPDPAGAVHLANQRTLATTQDQRSDPALSQPYSHFYSLLVSARVVDRIEVAMRSTQNTTLRTVLAAGLEADLKS
jgi:hypothetical protein